MNPTVLFRLLPLLPAVSLVAQEVPPVGEAPAPFLNEAPAFPGKVSGPRARTVGALGGFTVAVSSREQSRLLYNTVHEASNGVPVQWTGSVSTGVAGTTSDEFQESGDPAGEFLPRHGGDPGECAVELRLQRRCPKGRADDECQQQPQSHAARQLEMVFRGGSECRGPVESGARGFRSRRGGWLHQRYRRGERHRGAPPVGVVSADGDHGYGRHPRRG